MRNAVEFLKNQTAAKKIAELEALVAEKRKLVESTKQDIVSLQRILLPHSNDLENLENELAKAEIAELGEWHYPRNDAYWQRAIVRKERETKADLEFMDAAFHKAGLLVSGVMYKTRHARFEILGFENEDVETQDMRPRVLYALYLLADLYPINDVHDKFVVMHLGTVKDQTMIEDINNPFQHEDAETSFDVKISKTEKIAKLFNVEHTGDDYLEDLAEEILGERSRMMRIPYQSGYRIGRGMQ